MTLHILVNVEKEHIVNAIKGWELDGAIGLRSFIRIHTEQEECPLARIIVKKGEPVKVIQAGDENQ